MLSLVAPTAWTTLLPPGDILGKNAPPGVGRLRSGYALPPSAHPRAILILIDAGYQLDCRALKVACDYVY